MTSRAGLKARAGRLAVEIGQGIHDEERRLRVVRPVEELVGILQTEPLDRPSQDVVRVRHLAGELREELRPHADLLGTLSREERDPRHGKCPIVAVTVDPSGTLILVWPAATRMAPRKQAE